MTKLILPEIFVPIGVLALFFILFYNPRNKEIAKLRAELAEAEAPRQPLSSTEQK